MKFKVVALLSVSALLLLSAFLSAQVGIAAPAAPQDAAATDAMMTTVLPLKEAQTLFKFYFNADSLFGKQDRNRRVKETFWTPTAADAAQADADLVDYMKIQGNPASTPRLPVSAPSKYFRQYAGVMRGDKKIILINCFSVSNYRNDRSMQKIDPYWRSHVNLVYDGGFAFFHAAYNPATHQIVHLELNGIA